MDGLRHSDAQRSCYFFSFIILTTAIKSKDNENIVILIVFLHSISQLTKLGFLLNLTLNRRVSFIKMSVERFIN